MPFTGHQCLRVKTFTESFHFFHVFSFPGVWERVHSGHISWRASGKITTSWFVPPYAKEERAHLRMAQRPGSCFRDLMEDPLLVFSVDFPTGSFHKLGVCHIHVSFHLEVRTHLRACTEMHTENSFFCILLYIAKICFLLFAVVP